MGGGKMNAELSKFVKSKYPISKADLFSCFIERSLSFIPQNGLNGLVTMESWMFLSSFEALRKKIIENTCIQSLTHFGWHIMRIAFGTVTFILEKRRPDDKFRGTYSYMEIDNINRETERPIHFPVKDNGRFKIANQKDFEKIPGSPIGYWVKNSIYRIFENSDKIQELGDVRQGLIPGNTIAFLRHWYEVNNLKIGYNSIQSSDIIKYKKRWFLYNKGGGYRRWYGNIEHIINLENDGYEIKYSGYNNNYRLRDPEYYFQTGLTWSKISSGRFSMRLMQRGCVFDIAGCSIFKLKDNEYILGLCNSKIIDIILELISPTLNYEVDHIKKLPVNSNVVFFDNIVLHVQHNISISKSDWDSHETSWDFQQNELIRCKSNCGQNCADIDLLSEEDREEILEIEKIPTDSNLLEDCFESYKSEWRRKFFQLHRNEEELNRQFIEIYGLQDELTPDVPLEEITILQEETSIENGELVFHADEVFAQFVSYAVGCMFGRYSLDKEGLILANQGETLQDYLEKVGRKEEELIFVPDRDNIIPVLDDEWFRDDIVERFQTFLKASFGEENFRKNLDFVEECLGKDIRKYFTRDFYKDHIRRYKKRPIYWMFSSPKGYFNVLVYLHRYTPDTINRILNSYLKEYIEKLKMYRTQQEHIEVEGSVTEQNKARKEIDRINVMLDDCMQYETEILYPLATERISLDLDDGVLVNYNKLGSAVAKVAGLNDKKTKEKVRGFDWIDVSQIRD
jgi:hypothetical protein